MTPQVSIQTALAFLTALMLAILARMWLVRDRLIADAAVVKVADRNADTEFRAQLFRRIAELEASVAHLGELLDSEQEKRHECQRRCDVLEGKVGTLEATIKAHPPPKPPPKTTHKPPGGNT